MAKQGNNNSNSGNQQNINLAPKADLMQYFITTSHILSAEMPDPYNCNIPMSMINNFTNDQKIRILGIDSSLFEENSVSKIQ